MSMSPLSYIPLYMLDLSKDVESELAAGICMFFPLLILYGLLSPHRLAPVPVCLSNPHLSSVQNPGGLLISDYTAHIGDTLRIQ